MKRQSSSTLLTTIILCAMVGAAQVTTSHHAGSMVRPKPAASAPTDSVQYKGIFEPVNYGQDINLTDVFFVSPDVGWVSGEHATILKTTDGGKTWKAQVGGDPNGPEKPIGQLRFLDARHGWAVTGDSPQHLLRTMDGENWEQIGEEPGNDYAFTSVRHAIALVGNMGGFYVTNDGGRHWHNVALCKVRVIVQGLPHTEDCRVQKLQMVSSRSGYASADWSGGVAFFRTDDAGEHWTQNVNDIADWGSNNQWFFTDLDHGVMLMNTGGGRTYLTSDGARTWHALLSGSIGLSTAGLSPLVRFADPEVGWVIGPSPDNSDTFRVSYSADSGQHWKMSHNIAFPLGPRYAELRFNFPRRDRAYVIGPHGMIYRYRVVPTTYTAANALDAPPMPGVNGIQINAGMVRIRRDILALQAKLNPALVAAGLPPVTATPAAPVSDSATGGTTSGIASDNSAPPAADSASTSDATPTGTTGSTAGTASPSAASFGDAGQSTSTDSTAPATYVAGTSPASADSAAADASATAASADVASTAVQSCCAAQVQQLQSDVSSFQQQVPAFTSKYRTLNLIVAGIRVAQDMIGKAEAFKTTLIAFKKAPNLQSAAAVLQDFIGKYDSTRQEFASGFNNPTPLADAESGTASTTVAAAPDTGALVSPATDATIPGTAAGTPVPPAQSQGDQSQSAQTTNATVTQSADQAVQKVEDKIKKKIPKWPH